MSRYTNERHPRECSDFQLSTPEPRTRRWGWETNGWETNLDTELGAQRLVVILGAVDVHNRNSGASARWRRERAFCE